MTVAETERANAAAEAKSRAVVLEMIGRIGIPQLVVDTLTCC